MYWWKDRTTKKVSFIFDHQMSRFDPKDYFKSENVESWSHRRDDDFVIDMYEYNKKDLPILSGQNPEIHIDK